MGSGKYLNRSIEKNGIENFTKEILFVFDNPETMFAKEAELVNEDYLSEGNTYNLKLGGLGGWIYVNSNTDLRQQTSKASSKYSLDRWKYDSDFRNTTIERLVKFQFDSKSGKNQSKKATIKRKQIFPEGTFKNKKHKETSKKLIGLKNSNYFGSKHAFFGTEWITDGIKNMRVKKGTCYPDGFKHGRTPLPK